MTTSPLGRVLIIANPAAHSGDGERGARFADNFFKSYTSATNGYDLVLTTKSGDAIDFARKSRGYDTVLALGGDGVIHETVTGLMTIPAEKRPALGILPIGSGNDYARTLGMTINDVQAAAAQLVRSHAEKVELGCVQNEYGETGYFVETLSFGLDAAIAHDTTDRRAKDTRAKGEALFITSGLKLVASNLSGRTLRVRFDGGPVQEMVNILFAIQVGPTYGGGFQICPDARPTDGLLNCCYTISKPNVIHALSLFARARTGGHIRSRTMATGMFSHAELEFEEELPTQIDGEVFRGSRFTVDVLPHELTVLVPSGVKL